MFEESLNGPQLAAATFGDGPLLVVAGAGTGKTTTLAARVAHGTISVPEAGLGVVLNSLASTAIKVPLVARISGDRLLTARVALALGLVMAAGILGTFLPLAPLQTLAAAIFATPADFVEMARVDAARRLLEESETPLQRVASRCGFGSPDTMRRAFLRRIGAGPSDYRDRFRR